MKYFSIPAMVVIAIAICSCNRQPSTQVVNHFDLSDKWNRAEEVMLSSIAEDIEYISLETTPDNLIGNHRSLKVTVLEKYLVVHEHNKVMKLFDRQGKFLHTIGKFGKGPEEYIPLNKYYVDKTHDNIYILTTNKKCMIYGFDGQLKNEIKLKEYANQIIVDSRVNIGLLYLAETPLLKDSAKFVWLTPEGKEKSSIPLYGNRQMGGGIQVASNVQCYWHEKSLRFAEIPFDTVYQFDELSGLKPVWSFESGPMRIPEKVLHNRVRFITEEANFSILYYLWESDSYFFLTGGYENATRKILCNKNTGLSQLVDISEQQRRPGESGLINDLDGGLPFWPKTIENNLAITCLSPLEIIENKENQSEPELTRNSSKLALKYNSMVRGLKIDDNPIVMIVKLK